jgi:hypothetical protein
MINDTRTILLNEAGPRVGTKSIPGDEYIPAFTVIDLSQALKPVDRVLYGANPDYEGKVYRITQYMKILHNSGYEDYVLSSDPRITYDPYGVTVAEDNVANFQNGTYDTSYVLGGNDISIIGSWPEGGEFGRVTHSWQIQSVSGTSILVVNDATGESALYETLTGTKLLPGSELRISINTQPLPVGRTWTAVYKTRPLPDIGVIVASLRALPDSSLSAVFGAPGRTEPLASFYALFRNHPMTAQQLAGFLLAYNEALRSLRKV